jgi:Winged helix DNA-binding domain
VEQDPAAQDLLRARLRAQGLSGPPASGVRDVAERVLAVQAQDPRGFRLAVRARSTGLSAADVDAALTQERSVVVTTLNRGTLHLVTREDYPWLHALTTPPLGTASARRLAQEGVPPDAAERGVDAVERALASEGPLSRAQLAERVAAAGVRTQGQALAHVLMLTSLRGLTVRGPVVDGQHAWVLVRDWLGPPAPVPDRDTALGELARRYLSGHGPAAPLDLARWAGLPLRDARRGLAAAGRLEERPDGLVDLPDRPAAPPPPPPRLLGPFDPLLHGWVSRELVLGTHTGVVTSNGLFRLTALVGGRAVATWAMPAGRVVLAPFTPLAPPVSAALDADAAAVVRYLGVAPRG